MSVPFPYQVALGAAFSASPDQVAAATTSESGDVLNRIAGFRTQAEGLSTQALGLLQSAASFSAGSPRPVGFGASSSAFKALQNAPTVAFPTPLFRFDGGFDRSMFGDPPKLKIDDFKQSSFRKPSADGADFDAAPESPSSISAPTAPAESNMGVDVPEAPDVTITPPALLEVGGPPPLPGSLENLDERQPELIEVDELDLGTVDLPDEAALDRMEAMIDRKFERSPYTGRMMPQVMQAIGAMLSGSMQIDLDELDAGVVENLRTAHLRHSQIVGTLWSRRRFTGHGFAAGYSDRVHQRVLEEHRADFDAAVERWRMRLVPTLLRLATEAHAFAAEMEGELYDYDFELLAVEHQAMQALYGLAVARFNIGLAQMNVEAARYRGLVEYVTSKAENYRSLTQLARSVSQINNAISDGYSSELRAQGVEADSFAALVGSADAQVKAFDAQMRGREAQARALRAELVKYQAEVAGWSAEVSSAEADYRVVRAKNRAAAAQNRARAAEMSIEVAEQVGAAQEARALAMEAVAKSSQLQAELASRMGEHTQRQFDNTREALQYQSDVLDYRIDVAKFGAELADDNQINTNISRTNASVAATFSELGRNSIRAAELTQQSRIQLSDAYTALYDAIGRADAARVSGELSKYRASLALRTSGDIDYSSQISSDAQYSSDVTNAGSNTRRTEWVAAEEAG